MLDIKTVRLKTRELKFFFYLYLLVGTLLYAQNDYSLRAAVGSSSAHNFNDLYKFRGLNPHEANTKVYGLSGAYKLTEDILDWPVDFYINGSLNYFDENGHQKDFLEADIYIKLFFKFDFWSNQFRYGIGKGVSYAERIPYVEALEAIEKQDNQSQLLNYMEMTFDFDIGKFLRSKQLEEVYIGYLIKHRSGVRGLYNGVREGGSNYNCFYIEKNF